jgi:TRAP-type mannitol/chloroaromatic compound transport system substrate-binding protein
MNIAYINDRLALVKEKLESLNPSNLEAIAEGQTKPSEQSQSRLSAAKKRLQRLYDKNTKNRPDHTKVQGTGAKR